MWIHEAHLLRGGGDRRSLANGRCRMHGGATTGATEGRAQHARLKHGLYLPKRGRSKSVRVSCLIQRWVENRPAVDR
jgi:hypothetical protein